MYTLAAKVRSSNFGNLTLYDFSSRQCLLSFHRICGHQAVLTSTLSTDLGHRPAASLSVAGAQHWWTEAAFAAPFAAYLAWHWPHHWQCNWHAFAHVCGQKTDKCTRATIVTIFSHMTRDVSVFVKCDTIF